MKLLQYMPTNSVENDSTAHRHLTSIYQGCHEKNTHIHTHTASHAVSSLRWLLVQLWQAAPRPSRRLFHLCCPGCHHLQLDHMFAPSPADPCLVAWVCHISLHRQ